MNIYDILLYWSFFVTITGPFLLVDERNERKEEGSDIRRKLLKLEGKVDESEKSLGVYIKKLPTYNDDDISNLLDRIEDLENRSERAENLVRAAHENAEQARSMIENILGTFFSRNPDEKKRKP
jgi:seryl-tRNA synthetase